MKLIVDSVLAHEPMPASASWIGGLPGGSSAVGLLAWLAGGTLALFLAGWLNQTAQSYIQAGVGSRMVYDLGRDLLDHLQRLSLRFHGKQRTGDLIQRVTANSSCVRELVLDVCIALLTSLITLVAMFAVMWRLDASLSLAALLVAPLLALIIHKFAGPLTERSYQHQQAEGDLLGGAEETLSALPVVQAFGCQELEDRRFSSLCRRTGKAFLRRTVLQLQLRVSANSVTAVGTAAIMLFGALHVLQGKLSLGGLLVFLSYLGSLFAPLATLAYLSSSLASAAAGARRVFEVLDHGDLVKEAPGARPLPRSPGGSSRAVRFENVSFGYESGHAILHDVNLEAVPGETVALVGPTGAGKSTLISLIPRFFDPWEGRVTFDGVDIRTLPVSNLRSEVALVTQDPLLLPLSISENIAYGRPEASRKDIVAAAEAAHADEFIHRLPLGYDTVIGERGATLSVGQRQRLTIARAILKNASVLILDEPTSALDAQTEALLLDALDRLMRATTTFVIAHRLSTIRRADRIAVLEGGRIVESGTHEELWAAQGRYRRMSNLQTGTQRSGDNVVPAPEPALRPSG